MIEFNRRPFSSFTQRKSKFEWIFKPNSFSVLYKC